MTVYPLNVTVYPQVALSQAALEAEFGDAQVARAKAIFEQYDKDAAGTVDAAELTEMLAMMGVEASAAEVR